MKWQKHFTREYSFFKGQEYFECLFDSHLTALIPGFKKTSQLLDGFEKPEVWYYYPSEWQKEIVKKFSLLFSFPKQLKRFFKYYEEANDSLLKFIEDLKKIYFSSLSNQELIALLNKSHQILLPSYAFGIWGIWVFTEYLSFDDLIKKHLGFLNQEEKQAILTPPKLSDFLQEQLELRKLDLKNKSAVKKHIKKFNWFPCIDIYQQPWTAKDFIRRQKELIKSKETIDLKERKRLLMIYGKLIKNLPPQKLKIAEILHKLIYYRDQRNDVRFYAHYFINQLYQEAAKRLKLTIKDFSFLTVQEVIKILKNELILNDYQKEIKQRKQGYLIHKDNDRVKIITGSAAKEIRNKYFLKPEENLKSFKGLSASSGKVKGKVLIIRKDQDLKRMKKGLILVAIFTRPHYLIAMRQAKAVITEEGGLTSHAAIIAREFKIPTVVGTKIASKVLKDGDLVEVDAEKGIVKILL